MSVNIIFKNHFLFCTKNHYIIYLCLVMMKNWEKSIYALARNFWGTCSSVEMLKGYMFRERLGTPGVDELDEATSPAADIR